MKNITFINAGAGSGKTYRLTTTLAHKLTQEGLNPSQVILTTFTELAAAEFREKARKEILAAKMDDGTPVDAQVRIESATQLDNAYIGTVHSISFRFIRKYWYLLGYGADIQPMSDQNQDFYMSQSISSIVTEEDRRVFRSFREAFDIKDGYSNPDHRFWLPELKEIVDKMEYYDINDVKQSVEESYKTAEKIFCGREVDVCFAEINPFLASYKDYLGTFDTNTAKNYLECLEKFGYVLKNVADLHTPGLRDCMIKQTGSKKAKENFYGDDYEKALNAYQEAAVSKDYLPIIKSYLETIFDLAIRWKQQLQQYKQENHVISFDDMEKIFLQMLTDEQYKEVQDDIRNNFRLLMVDEFQDSNPIQLKIFNRISELIAEKEGESIWVGDPKQAIYGFRGSDSHFIAEILSKFEFSDNGEPVIWQGEEKLGTDQLLESWRSRPALVNFSNAIFKAPFLKSGLKEKQITLKAHFTDETDTMSDTGALYVWRTESDNSGERVGMLAAKIKQMLGSKMEVHHKACDMATSEITYRDIAVLCFSNAECNKVASQLRKLGLPVSCEEGSLMQCLEVYLLKTLLLFVQNPADKMLRAELAILLDDASTEAVLKDRIDYVACHYKENEKGWDQWLDADSKNSHAATIAKLAEQTARYKNLSISDAVVAIHEELDLNNIVEKWGDITQRKHNLSTVVNMAKAYDDMCLQMGMGSSIIGFVNYLTVTNPNNKSDNTANTIKVLTYHRSKGLEWPVVILYQLWKDFNDEQDLVKKKFRGVNVCEAPEENHGGLDDIFTRKHYIHLFPKGIGGTGSSDLPDRLFETIISKTDGSYDYSLFQLIVDQSREEALRLLYVGVTRAKDVLVSITSLKNTQKGGELISQWPLDLGIGDGASAHPFGEGYGETLEELRKPAAEDGTTTPKYRPTLNTPGINPALPLSISPSVIKTFDNMFTGNEEAATFGERIIDMGVFAGEQSDALKGTCIHNIFAAFEQGDNEGNMRRTTQTLDNFGFSSASQEQKKGVLQSIAYLYTYLSDTFGPATHIEKECPLRYPMDNGQVLGGEIDLLWFYRDGNSEEKCVLVDYKTFPGRNDQIAEHTKRYYPQLSAYRAALTAAGIKVADTLIYYPVQGHIRRLTQK